MLSGIFAGNKLFNSKNPAEPQSSNRKTVSFQIKFNLFLPECLLRYWINIIREEIDNESSVERRSMNIMNIKIIPYQEKYAEETVRMWRDSKEKALGQKEIHDYEDHLNFLKTVLVAENKVLLAFDEADEKVVGILAVAGSELNQLYIHNDYQGAGIGSRLLEIAKEMSATLRLFTFEVNKNAQKFYEKHGFKIIGRGFENEENLPDILYEWKNPSL